MLKVLLTCLAFLYLLSPVNGQSALSLTDIDGAHSEAISQNRIVKIRGSVLESIKELNSLPVVFRSVVDGLNYDVIVMDMEVQSGNAKLKVACKFQPYQASSVSLYFGSDDIAVSGQNGFQGSLKLLKEQLTTSKNGELSANALAISGKTSFVELPVPRFGTQMVLGLDEDTELSFTCGSFEKFQLSGYVKSFSVLGQTDMTGKPQNAGQASTFVFSKHEVKDWNDMMLKAKPADGFYSVNYKDLTFISQEAMIDLSMRQNAHALPSCLAGEGKLWMGLYFPILEVKIPNFIQKKDGSPMPTIAAQHFLLDSQGLIGNITANDLVSLENGTTGGASNLDMSLSSVSAVFLCNGYVKADLSGLIGLKDCNASTYFAKPTYNFSFDEKMGYSYLLRNGNSASNSNELKLASGSSITFNMASGAISVNKRLRSQPIISTDAYKNAVCKTDYVNLTVKDCLNNIEWSTGETSISIKVSPQVTQKYTARCFDQFCVEALSNEIEIKVVELSPQVIISNRSEATFCSNLTAEISNSGTCVGEIMWEESTADNVWNAITNNSATYLLSKNALTQNTQYSYRTYCKLNRCISPYSNVVSHTLLKTPSIPIVVTTPDEYTVCKQKTLAASGCVNGSYVWYKNDLEISNSTATVVEAAEGNFKYNVACLDGSSTCMSDKSTDIYFKIEKCYCKPAAPKVEYFSGDGKSIKEGEQFTFVSSNCANGTIKWHDPSGIIGSGTKLERSEKEGTYGYGITCVGNDGCTSDMGYTERFRVKGVCETEDKPSMPTYNNASPAATTTEQDIKINMTCINATVVWYDESQKEISSGSNYTIVHAAQNTNKSILLYTRCKTAAGCYSDYKPDYFRINSKEKVCDPTLAPINLTGSYELNGLTDYKLVLKWEYQECDADYVDIEMSSDKVTWKSRTSIGIFGRYKEFSVIWDFVKDEKYYFRVLSWNGSRYYKSSNVYEFVLPTSPPPPPPKTGDEIKPPTLTCDPVSCSVEEGNKTITITGSCEPGVVFSWGTINLEGKATHMTENNKLIITSIKDVGMAGAGIDISATCTKEDVKKEGSAKISIGKI